MAWIELHQSVWTHRKTLVLAAALGMEDTHAAGHVLRLWTWALDNAPHGQFGGLPASVIAIGAGWRGDAETFVAALVACGYLEQTDSGLVIHDWHDYAGRLITQREQAKERTRSWRDRHKSPVTVTNEHVTHNEHITYGATVPNLTVQNHTNTETNVSVAPAEPDAAPAPTDKQPIQAVPKPKERERGWIERHPLWQAVTDTFGRPTTSQMSSVAASLRDLDELGATDEELRRRAAIYPAVMGTAADGTPILMTLRALVKHWSACARAPTAPPAKVSRYSAHHIDPDLAVARLEAALNGGKSHANTNGPSPGTGVVPLDVAASFPRPGQL